MHFVHLSKTSHGIGIIVVVGKKGFFWCVLYKTMCLKYGEKYSSYGLFVLKWAINLNYWLVLKCKKYSQIHLLRCTSSFAIKKLFDPYEM